MSKEAVREGALAIGEQLAAIETSISRIMGAVMTAAIHHSSAAADPTQAEADRLDDMVTALAADLRRFRKALRS